ncbi:MULTISPECIES: isoaspartyl peptidase/L-asparaginase family protein [Streptomyces]|uniref:Isoaspartyl peptidase/L-asparaginase n=1 Tax=Streptomyces tsukubensis (strain DSM 42081 / NBRC 108919 / NRRL 18488 / 9993) TaxID=1114943 RepID=I2MT62_STRT9|nr:MULTISPECIES: isoaspartyl peptidase/L-asparaginase [Streptomyces]AZK92563.1 isoaspartyl peptidase/L-asparaginase [Streptomyces tsukubensis]EIF87959.1 peptidase T2 asparaginase 2 [Streptomyces tsukubensis NRRL18488]MYS65917.1 beta-aspartyl-peptidase [Streptomyces sp. SID5473]QKM71257.1 isoaspartyl peptidase/L-asparaginase [Streptomyces tsukubensis NRRL18488]TAI40424.1 isoaspartyl peptidase/L-asparaginase [Streptomyces tsukubensis]
MSRRAPLAWLPPALLTVATILVIAAVPQSRPVDDPDGTDPSVRAVRAEQARPDTGPPAALPGGRARPDARDVVLAVHGGAGAALNRETTSPQREKAYRDGLATALRAGQRVLDRGGSSVDAVEAAVKRLEDDPLFNAGKGAVFNADAEHELDASVMRGSDLAAGAVAGVRSLRNPVEGARLVMEKSKHVLIAGEGADDFGARGGLATVTQDYYWTQARWDALMRAKEAERGSKSAARSPEALADLQSQGTVGAVAVDGRGDVAAATSTGGMTNKLPGRIGDSPLIGAGTYAKNSTLAVSATGAGEFFIRGAASSTISDLMEFKGLGVAPAAYDVVVERLPRLGGQGGVIALTREGVFDAPHSSPGMLHGYLTEDGDVVTKMFPDESPANT